MKDTIENRKNKIGQSRVFKSPEELQEKVDKYFKSITIDEPQYHEEHDKVNEKGKTIYKRVPLLNNAGNQVIETRYYEHPTVSGLAEALGVCTDTLQDRG